MNRDVCRRGLRSLGRQRRSPRLMAPAAGSIAVNDVDKFNSGDQAVGKAFGNDHRSKKQPGALQGMPELRDISVAPFEASAVESLSKSQFSRFLRDEGIDCVMAMKGCLRPDRAYLQKQSSQQVAFRKVDQAWSIYLRHKNAASTGDSTKAILADACWRVLALAASAEAPAKRVLGALNRARMLCRETDCPQSCEVELCKAAARATLVSILRTRPSESLALIRDEFAVSHLPGDAERNPFFLEDAFAVALRAVGESSLQCTYVDEVNTTISAEEGLQLENQWRPVLEDLQLPTEPLFGDKAYSSSKQTHGARKPRSKVANASRKIRNRLLALCPLLVLRHELGQVAEPGRNAFPAKLTTDEKAAAIAGFGAVLTAKELLQLHESFIGPSFTSKALEVMLSAAARECDHETALNVFDRHYAAEQSLLVAADSFKGRDGSLGAEDAVWPVTDLAQLMELYHLLLRSCQIRKKPSVWNVGKLSLRNAALKAKEDLLHAETLYRNDLRLLVALNHSHFELDDSRFFSEAIRGRGRNEETEGRALQWPASSAIDPYRLYTCDIFLTLLKAHVSQLPYTKEHAERLLRELFRRSAPSQLKPEEVVDVLRCARWVRPGRRDLVQDLDSWAESAGCDFWTTKRKVPRLRLARLLEAYVSAAMDVSCRWRPDDFSLADRLYHAILEDADGNPAHARARKVSNHMVQIYFGSSRPEEAMAVMNALGPSHTTTQHYNSAMYYWLHIAGDHKRAKQVFAEMQSCGLVPNAQSLDLLVCAELEAGPSEDELRELTLYGSGPSLSAHVSEAAAHLFAIDRNYRGTIKPRPKTLRLLAQLCRGCGNKDELARIESLAKARSIFL